MDAGTILFLSIAAALTIAVLVYPYKEPTSLGQAIVDFVAVAASATAVPLIFGTSLAATRDGRSLWPIAAVIGVAWLAFAWRQLAARLSAVGAFFGWRPSLAESVLVVAFFAAIGALLGTLAAPVAGAWAFLAATTVAFAISNVQVAGFARRLRLSAETEPDEDLRTEALATYAQLRTQFGSTFFDWGVLFWFTQMQVVGIDPNSPLGWLTNLVGLCGALIAAPWVISGGRLLSRVARGDRAFVQPWPPWP